MQISRGVYWSSRIFDEMKVSPQTVATNKAERCAVRWEELFCVVIKIRRILQHLAPQYRILLLQKKSGLTKRAYVPKSIFA